MKKIFFFIITSIFMISLFALSSSAATNHVECDIQAAYIFRSLDPENSEAWMHYTINEYPVEYPLSAHNLVNLEGYAYGQDWLYLDGKLPNLSSSYTFNITFFPMRQGDEPPEGETYINTIEFEAVVMCPTRIEFEEFWANVKLQWARSDVENEGDISAQYRFSRVVEIIDQKTIDVVGHGYDELAHTGTLNLYVVKVKFVLDEPINIVGYGNNGYYYPFRVIFPVYSPWVYITNTPIHQDTQVSFQFPVKRLHLSYQNIDDVVAGIGGQLTDINNNIIILQGLSGDIIDALKHSEYADKVDEYINHVGQTVGRTEDAGRKEQELWGNISFDADVSFDPRFVGMTSFLWNPWLINCVLLVMAIAMISYALYGKAG